jgi:hypothetical protein
MPLFLAVETLVLVHWKNTLPLPCGFEEEAPGWKFFFFAKFKEPPL